MQGKVTMGVAGALMAALAGFVLSFSGAGAVQDRGPVPLAAGRVAVGVRAATPSLSARTPLQAAPSLSVGTPLPLAAPLPTPRPEQTAEGPGLVAQEARPYTANVALFPDARDGDTRNNYNNTSVIWAGPVSPDGEHVQTRLLGRADGIMTYIQVFRPRAEGTVELEINGRSFAATYRSSPGWEWGFRCNGAGECRGWTAFRVIPWAELGGMPQLGDEWPLRQAAFGHNWEGVLRWGLPAYGGEPVGEIGSTVGSGAGMARLEEDVQLLTLPLTADAPVGGHSNCGSDDWPEYFPTWGLRNTDAYGAWVTPTPLGSIEQANIAQNQNDVADWPCYDKYYARFGLDGLPAGAQVLAATMEVRHFGNAGYGAGYEPDGAQDTVVQVYEVDTWWDEMEITWDNAPQPRENIGRITMLPIDVTCPSLTRCSVPYLLDVTEIVRRAQAQGRTWGSLATYTGSGDYHSGKYIWTREAADQAPVVRVWYRMRGPEVATAVATRTATGTPGVGTPAAGATGTAAAPRPPVQTPAQTPSPAPTPLPTPTTAVGTPGTVPTATPGSADPGPPGTVTAPAAVPPPGTPRPEAQAVLFLPELCRDK